MTTWLNLLAVATGGAVGSVCRYLITVASIAIPGGSTLFGTTIVNLIGCAAIGGFAEVVLVTNSLSERTQLLIRVGFLGGLTTFPPLPVNRRLWPMKGVGWPAAFTSLQICFSVGQH